MFKIVYKFHAKIKVIKKLYLKKVLNGIEVFYYLMLIGNRCRNYGQF